MSMFASVSAAPQQLLANEELRHFVHSIRLRGPTPQTHLKQLQKTLTSPPHQRLKPLPHGREDACLAKCLATSTRRANCSSRARVRVMRAAMTSAAWPKRERRPGASPRGLSLPRTRACDESCNDKCCMAQVLHGPRGFALFCSTSS